MEKKMWVAPQMEGMEFFAGEYCESVCGEGHVVYNFTCDAGGGESGYVWLETNNWIPEGATGNTLQKEHGDWIGGSIFDPIYEYEADKELGGYHACGITHQASATNEFLHGYYQEYSSYGEPENPIIPVIVWRGPDGDNIHCTTQLDMNKWTTAKS